MGSGWIRVSKAHPCPCCGRGDWCGVSADGAVCHCMRVESDRPCASGGWFHFLVERPARPERTFWTKPPARPRLFDAGRTMAGFRAEFLSRPGSLAELAADIALPAASVARMEAGRSAFHGAWAFPMRDGEGKVVGIRLREYGGSRKWSVAGSRDGLFYDPALEPREASENGVRGREVVVVEGATDCIAGHALGLPCVGRSSCGTGADTLKDLCARLGVSRVTIVADNDGYKTRPDGTVWRPGLDGAKALAARLCLAYRIIVPPVKDLRDWLTAGLTPERFAAVAALMPWRRAAQRHGPVICKDNSKTEETWKTSK